MAKVKLGLRGLTTLQKLDKAKSVADKVARHIQTDTADIPLPGLVKAVNMLEKAIKMAEFGDKRAIAAKRMCEKQLEKAISDMGLAIDRLAKGQQSIIQSCGFEVRSTNNRSMPLSAPQTLEAKRMEQPGMVFLKWQPVMNSKSYLVQTCTKEPSKNTDWHTSGFSTKSRCTLDALTPGTKYWFRVKPIGAKGVGPPSDVVSISAA